MARIKAKNNKAEVLLRKSLWNRGYRYRTYDRKLPGSPDIVFASRRIVIFVDGDYWHGRILIEKGRAALRKSFRTERKEFWIAKITRNVERDRQNNSDLRKLGWRVIRIWERDILKDVQAITDRVERQLRSK